MQIFGLALSLVACALSADASVENTPKLRFLSSFKFNKPAFITALRDPLDPAYFDLIISSFGVSLFRKSPEGVFYIKDIADAVSRKNFQVLNVGDSVVWPNEVNLLDDTHLIVPGGFLVPGKKGHISIMDYDTFRKNATDAKWEKIIDAKEGFFHRVEKINIYNQAAKAGDDGRRMVSCLGRKGVFNSGGGEMVFLEQGPDGKYKTNIIEKGCDCYFTTVDYNNDGIPEFIVPAFFGKKVFLMWTEHPLGDYSQREFVKQRVIDADIGAAFDLQSVDLDGDGIEEVIVTNHQNGKKGTPPSVFAYHVVFPKVDSEQHRFAAGGSAVSSFMNGLEFKRYTLSSNFTIVNRSFMAAAPGGAQAVLANDDIEAAKYSYPVLLVSGDGAEKAYMLTRANDQDKFAYEQQEVHDCKGTVGGIYVGDIDGDGWKEVFIPCYDSHYVAIYTFKP